MPLYDILGEIKMKRICLLTIMVLTGLSLANDTPAEPRQSKPIKPQRIQKVRTASFELKNGKSVSGKVLEDSKLFISLLVPNKGLMVKVKYPKSQIKYRISYKSYPEQEYYEILAGNFLDQTWDFRNDPDEFIQALRCYEKAKEIIKDVFGEDHEKVAYYNNKIKNIEAQRQKWFELTKDRAEQIKVEDIAEFDNRIQELTNRLDSLTNSVDKILEENQSLSELQEKFNKSTAYIYETLKKLEYTSNSNTDDIRDLYDRTRRRSCYGGGYVVPKPVPTPK